MDMALGDMGYGGLGNAGGMVGLDGLRDYCGSLGLHLSHLLHLPDPHSLSHLSFSTAGSSSSTRGSVSPSS